MVLAYDKSFNAAPPGISIAHHKLGELPHEKPPKYTVPNDALEYLWKLLLQPRIQRQIWDILKIPGTPVEAIAKAVLYKASLDGIIQLNLAIVIYPTVFKMISTIAKAGGVDAKQFHDTTTPQKERYIKQGLKALMLKYDKDGVLSGKPPKGTNIAPEIATPDQMQQAQPAAGAQGQQGGGGANPQGIAGNTQPPAPNPTQQGTPAPGILGMAPQQPSGGQ